MTGMAAATARSTGEVAALRAAAEIARHQSAYRATVADAVCQTLDWLTGETGVAPIELWRHREHGEPLTGLPVEPTPEAVAREMLRAVDAETAARRSGEPSAWPGKVGHTLSWWRAEPFVEPPLY